MASPVPPTGNPLPIQGLIGNSPQNLGANAQTGANSLSANDFLGLLTAELANQDPTKPVDDTQSVAQLAQFSALSATTQLSDQFAAFQSNFSVLQSTSLVGKNVTVVTSDSNGKTSNLSGTVASIKVQSGVPLFTMNDASGKPIADQNGKPQLFALSQIVGVGG